MLKMLFSLGSTRHRLKCNLLLPVREKAHLESRDHGLRVSGIELFTAGFHQHL